MWSIFALTLTLVTKFLEDIRIPHVWGKLAPPVWRSRKQTDRLPLPPSLSVSLSLCLFLSLSHSLTLSLSVAHSHSETYTYLPRLAL